MMIVSTVTRKIFEQGERAVIIRPGDTLPENAPDYAFAAHYDYLIQGDQRWLIGLSYPWAPAADRGTATNAFLMQECAGARRGVHHVQHPPAGSLL